MELLVETVVTPATMVAMVAMVVMVRVQGAIATAVPMLMVEQVELQVQCHGEQMEGRAEKEGMLQAIILDSQEVTAEDLPLETVMWQQGGL